MNIDIAFEGNFYSVPYTLVQEPVENALHADHGGDFSSRAARGFASPRSHPRPSYHRERAPAEESPSASGVDALAHGEVGRADRAAYGTAVQRILAEKPHPEMGYRSCLGIIRLAEQYSAARMEAAADRALRTGACRYQSVKSILKTSLDQQPLAEPPTLPPPPPLPHDNIRGAGYFSEEV